jgi:hypothetical protein
VMSALDYIGHLSTISAYLQLPAATRDHVFQRILTVLPTQATLNADLVLHMARLEPPRGSAAEDPPIREL